MAGDVGRWRPDWAALPGEVVLRLLGAFRDDDGGRGLPPALLLSAVCAAWRRELRGTPQLWRSLACARACRGLWAHGQPPAVPPAHLLRHRLLLRATRAAGFCLAPIVQSDAPGLPPRWVERAYNESRLMLVGQRNHPRSAAAHFASRAAAAEDADPVLLSVRQLRGTAGQTVTFAMLGPRDSPYGGAWLTVEASLPADFPYAPPLRCVVRPPLPHAGLLADGAVVADAHCMGAQSWSPFCGLFQLALDCACLLSQPAWPCAPEAVDAAAARRAAAGVLAPAGGAAPRGSDAASGEEDDDDEDDDLLQVALPPGRALLRVALHACALLPGAAEASQEGPSLLPRAVSAHALASTLRWAAAVARAPPSALQRALAAQLDAAAAAAHADADPRARASLELRWDAEWVPPARAHELAAELASLAARPPNALLTPEEEAAARWTFVQPIRGVHRPVQRPLPLRRLAALTLAQLAPADVAADAAAACDLGLLLLLREAEAGQGVRGAAPHGTAEALLATWQQAQRNATGPPLSLHAWLQLPL